MKKGLAAILLFVFAGVVTAQTLRNFERQAEDLRVNTVLDWADLAEEAEIQREIFNRITPPGYSWVQPLSGGVAPFEAANFSAKFLSRLQGVSSNAVAVYPLFLALDPKTRETVAYNAATEEIARATVPDLAMDWEENADSSRILLQVDLLEDKDVDLFAYAAQRIAESQRDALSLEEPPARSVTPTTGLRFAGVEFSSNGIPTFTLTSSEGDEAIEIFRYILAETSVASSFAGFSNAWEYVDILTPANGEIIWTDETLPTTNSIAFYAAAFVRYTDADTLSDGMELFVLHTDPANPDTDGDGIPDGVEIAWGLDPLNPADASEDPDGDGLTNAEEYALGNNPTEPDNDAVFVIFNPNPPPAPQYAPSVFQTVSTTETPLQYITGTNLRAKANSATRYKVGFKEFSSSNVPPSNPPKWYLGREVTDWEIATGQHQFPSSFFVRCSVNSSNYCYREQEPYSLLDDSFRYDLSLPTNHICHGSYNYYAAYYYHYSQRWYTAWDRYEFSAPTTNLGLSYTTYTSGEVSQDDVFPYGLSCTHWWTRMPVSISKTETYYFAPTSFQLWPVSDYAIGYEYVYERLFNEYTDEMLLDCARRDKEELPAVDELEWGKRQAIVQKTNMVVEVIPTNEYYAASLYISNYPVPVWPYPDLRPAVWAQELTYQWTVPTEAGVKYKLVWLEAFKPQDGTAYTEFTLRSEVFTGTGADYESWEYVIKPPEEFGTVEVLGFTVTLESDRAYKSPMAFGTEMPSEPRRGTWMEPGAAALADKRKIATSLTIPFDHASTPAGDVEDFDVTLRVVPDIFPTVTWELISGPLDSGILLDADTAVATFRNPTQGGLYKFKTTIPGLEPLYSQLWLPVSGPDISANFQDEIDFLHNWGGQYTNNLHQRILKRLGWTNIVDQSEYKDQQKALMRADIQWLGPNFDYELVDDFALDHVYGFAHEIAADTSSKPAGDVARLTLSGAARPYVIDFAKRNNMGYAICAKRMGFSDVVICLGPNIALFLGQAAGTRDDHHTIRSYLAGIALANGISLTTVMDQHGRAMQHPDRRLSKEWPDPTPGWYIQLQLEAYSILQSLAGE